MSRYKQNNLLHHRLFNMRCLQYKIQCRQVTNQTLSKTFCNPDIHNDLKHAMSVLDLVSLATEVPYFLKHPI